MNKLLETIYLDWVNNFLTVKGFSEHYRISEIDGKSLIDICRRSAVLNDPNDPTETAEAMLKSLNK